ncbi:Kinase, NEK [Giardia lamblia P15]|uniref:non-specific serine/threonine protein kinase n=1 Tax=Giardia intestinalis (strain P15) TaxID=658858 RepID=E1EZ65_GIAIA|nr:Kinase, NEK [Giardia lamblia P15]
MTRLATLMSRYQLLDKLGKGSRSTIYLAQDNETGNYLVCKEICYRNWDSSELDLLEHEIMVNRALVHPNIMRYQYVLNDKENCRYYLLMNYFSKSDLGYQLVRRKETNARFKEATIWTFLAQLYDMLLYLHSVDKRHSTDVSIALLRDFRPSNFFLSSRGIIQIKSLRYLKLLDFGSVEAEPFTSKLPPLLVPYLAPDVLQGNYYSVSSDIWSLGCLLYELCTFQAFVTGHTPNDVLQALAAIRRPIILDHYSQSLSHVLSLMLQPNSRDRITLKQLGSFPQLKSAWEQYKTYIAHTRKPMGDPIPLLFHCKCGGDGYSCCLDARRKNGLPDTYISRRDFQSDTVTPSNLWQQETFSRLLTSKHHKSNNEFEVVHVNQHAEDEEGIKYERLESDAFTLEDRLGYTPNATSIVFTQPAIQTTNLSNTRRHPSNTIKESYFATHGRYPKGVVNRLVYSNENSRVEGDGALQTQFELVQKVTEDSPFAGNPSNAKYMEYGNFAGRTMLNTTIDGQRNMTMIGGVLGPINVDEIFKDDEVETQDRACSPIVISVHSPNYTRTELDSLMTNDGVTRHTKKHRNEFGDTISTCWQPSLKSNISSVRTLDLDEKVTSINMPSTPNYRPGNSSYDIYPTLSSNGSMAESLYANSLSPPKKNKSSINDSYNSKITSHIFPPSYKASFYDPKMLSTPKVFEEFSSDEEEQHGHMLREAVNYRRSPPASLYEEPLRLDYHRHPVQVPIVYTSDDTVSYIDMLKSIQSTTRAVGPNKPGKPKKQKKSKEPAQPPVILFEDDCSINRLHTPDRTMIKVSYQESVREPEVNDHPVSVYSRWSSPSITPQPPAVHCTYEHYHASYVPHNKLTSPTTVQVPLPGDYTHYAFSPNKIEGSSTLDKDIRSTHEPTSTNNLALSRNSTTHVYETHFLPHERYVSKHELQRTHPVTFSMLNTTTNWMKSEAQGLKNTLSTDRGVGGSSQVTL